MMTRLQARLEEAGLTKDSPPAPSAQPSAPPQRAATAATATASQGQVIIDLGDDRPPKSVDIHCKVEY